MKKSTFCLTHQVSNRILFLVILCLFSACQPKTTVSPQRTYRMGFQNSAPRIDVNLALQSLNMWTLRADAAIISLQVPWDSLYSGETPEQYVTNNFVALVNYYKSKNFKLWVYMDPENGLNRAADALDLAALGKSIAQAPVQQQFARFCAVMDSMLQPDHFGVALETNLIRGIAPDSIYQGVRSAANAAALAIKNIDNHVAIGVSVQAEWAWGMLGSGSYKGVDTDFSAFPFIQELGISSYPYFAYNQASDMPLAYYSRLILNHPTIPVFVSEGGWSSQMVATFAESPQKQADYITKQSQMLDEVNAIGWFQLTFTDIAASGIAPGTPANINQFAYTGLVDSNMQPKIALTNWDNVFHRGLEVGH